MEQGEDSDMVGIGREVAAAIEKLRQAAYDEGYADASSITPFPCGCTPQQLRQQGDL